MLRFLEASNPKWKHPNEGEWRWQWCWDKRCPELALLEDDRPDEPRFTLIYAPRAFHEEGSVTIYAGDDESALDAAAVEWMAKVRRESTPAPAADVKACEGSRLHGGYLNLRCERCWRCRGESKPVAA